MVAQPNIVYVMNECGEPIHIYASRKVIKVKLFKYFDQRVLPNRGL